MSRIGDSLVLSAIPDSQGLLPEVAFSRYAAVMPHFMRKAIIFEPRKSESYTGPLIAP
jgi:hypothetical protein